MNVPLTSLSSLRDYTQTELLALPADSRLLFADNVHNGLFTYDSARNAVYPLCKRRVLQPRAAVSPLDLQAALSRVRALRCISHGLSSFSLYPTNEHEYNVTRFLWRAANSFTFEAREAAALFQRNVFIICMPASLFDFLTAVTWEQVETSLIYILTCLADGREGMEVLNEDLAAPLVTKLRQFANVDDPTALVDPHAFRLFVDVIMGRIAWMGPWVVPTTLCYLSASDMTQLLSNRFDRDIFSAPHKFEVMQCMMWNIYRDWQTYHHVLVRNGEWCRRDALEVMACMILKKGQKSIDDAMQSVWSLCQPIVDTPAPPAVDIMLASAASSTTSSATDRSEQPRLIEKKGSLLASLPTDVVLNKVFPKLFEVYGKDLKENMRSDSSGSGRSPIEPASPVTVPFSLKSWVMENYKLEAFYRRCSTTEEHGESANAEPREEVLVQVDVVDEDDGEGVMMEVVEPGDDAKFSDDDDDDDNIVEIAEPIGRAGDGGTDSMAVEEALVSDLELDKELEDVNGNGVDFVEADVRDVVVLDANARVGRYDARSSSWTA